MSSTPAKYQADTRKFEDKDWLYEQYWGELRSVQDIADECGVSRKHIGRYMDRFGIPRRSDGRHVDDTVDPLDGFRKNTDDGQHELDWSDVC